MTEQLDARGRPRHLSQTFFDEPSLTVQSEKDQASIQHILRKYQQFGIVEHLNLTEAMFPDVSQFNDFADVVRAAKAAETQFMKLPSKIREIFRHDPAIWLDTAHDAEKRAALLADGTIETLDISDSDDSTLDGPGDQES